MPLNARRFSSTHRLAGVGEPLAPVPLHLLVQGQRVGHVDDEIVVVVVVVPHSSVTSCGPGAGAAGGEPAGAAGREAIRD